MLSRFANVNFQESLEHVGCRSCYLVVVVVVVVMTSPSGTAYMGGQMSQRDEEFHQTLNLEGSVSLDGHFIDWAPLKGGYRCPQLTYCRPLSNDDDGCRQTVKLQSVLRLCSGFYRSKDPTNSITVLKEYPAIYRTASTKHQRRT